MCNHTAAPIPTVLHTTAVSPATLTVALQRNGFQQWSCCVMKTAIGEVIPTGDSERSKHFALGPVSWLETL